MILTFSMFEVDSVPAQVHICLNMNIKTVADLIGMDYDAVLEDYCGDVSLLNERLVAFPSSTSLDNLSMPLKVGDYETLRIEAKKLRKASEKIGLTKLAAACKTLEKADGTDLQVAYNEVKKLYESVIAVLSKKR